jgi:hypothetical protein
MISRAALLHHNIASELLRVSLIRHGRSFEVQLLFITLHKTSLACHTLSLDQLAQHWHK